VAVRTGARSGPPADLPTGEEKTERVRSMFDAIAPRYDLVNRIMTFGLDRGWRRRTVDALGLTAGSLVVDLACGTGDLSALARAAGYRTVGADLSWGMLAANRRQTPVLQCDASRLPVATGCLDGVVCGYALRNFTDLPSSLAEAARVLRPGGRIAILEVGAPPGGLLRAGYRLWFERAVPVLGGALSDADAYRYLPRSTAYLPNEAGLRRLLVDAGFSAVGRRLLWGGLSQLLTATRVGLPPGAAPGNRWPSA
jgi:demethylmenaquinone methyltransferase / 2-methoxy-6-polyprenyl-1,4-benzoquinol methylase